MNPCSFRRSRNLSVNTCSLNLAWGEIIIYSWRLVKRGNRITYKPCPKIQSLSARADAYGQALETRLSPAFRFSRPPKYSVRGVLLVKDVERGICLIIMFISLPYGIRISHGIKLSPSVYVSHAYTNMYVHVSQI